jgi:type II secretory pathway pseudopilin PulG
MLVVIVIFAMVTSATIPILQSAAEARRTREGARLLSGFLGNAQTRAVAGGRSVAVIIQPLKNNGNAAMDLYLAEVPPPYIGDSLSSNVTLSGSTISFNSCPSFTSQGIRPGDLIRFNYRGQLYYLDANDSSKAYLTSTTGIPISPTDPTNTATPQLGTGVPFQVFRQPVKTYDTPGQLLDGAAIDLNFSGIDQNAVGYVAGGPGPISVTFSPTGSLDMIYAGGLVSRPITGISFLVGKIENIPQGAAPTTPNWQDPNSQWVFVARQTGLVTTNAVSVTPRGNPPVTNVYTSRYIGQSGQNQGGN